MKSTKNIRIEAQKPLISPNLLQEEIQIDTAASSTVLKARLAAQKIIHGEDDRILLIIGPCSIHDPRAALEYAQRLHQQAILYQDQILIVMRVYFEKPRTTVGWKGLINDPDLDSRFDINKGLRIARKLLLEINNMGLPTGSEFLDTTIPQYIADLTSWSAIGARTSESQIHRELASGLSMPVGFKNGTTGNIQVAIDAICAAANSHHFLGVSAEGLAAITTTTGNPDCHVILRGSKTEPNYDQATIQSTIETLKINHLEPRLMVDCSHGNSRKDYTRQVIVLQTLSDRIRHGDRNVFGIMIESNLMPGNQALELGKALVYGKSITDACIGWDETERALALLNESIIQRRKMGG